jgi:hypothetical protein
MPVRARLAALPALLALAPAGAALAQSPDYMMQDCAYSAQVFFQDFEARSEPKYEGQRTDGTHAVNGSIYLETRREDYQCSYNAAGDTMVGFYAEGRDWPGFVRGDGSPYMSGESGADDGGGAMAGAPDGETISVRFAPGASGATYEGRVAAGGTIRYVLKARDGQFLSVRVAPDDAALDYAIRNPDGSTLLDPIGADTPYRGQLWQRGDHVVEILNRTRRAGAYGVTFEIR